MQIFRKPHETWPEQWREQWVSGGYDHKRLEVRSAPGALRHPVQTRGAGSHLGLYHH